MKHLHLLAVLATVASPGCATFTALGPARTVDPGESQFYVAPEGMWVKRGGKPLLSPQVELGGRYGLTERVDVGARIWLPNVELDAQIPRRRAPSPDRGWDLAGAPGLGYLGGFSGSTEEYTDTLHIFTFSAPLLAGLNVGRGNQVIGSVRVVDQVWTGSGEGATTANILYLGGSLGFVWKVTHGLRLVPEVALASPLLQSLVDFGTHVGFGGAVVQVALGILFGGDRPLPPSQNCPAVPP